MNDTKKNKQLSAEKVTKIKPEEDISEIEMPQSKTSQEKISPAKNLGIVVNINSIRKQTNQRSSVTKQAQVKQFQIKSKKDKRMGIIVFYNRCRTSKKLDNIYLQLRLKKLKR